MESADERVPRVSGDGGPGGICGVCRRQYGRRFPESGVVCVHVSVKRGSRKRVSVLEKRVPEGQAVGMRW